MGNSFGKLFRLTTFGESHGKALGAIVEGCPAGLELDEDLIRLEMQRRKPGQSKITTQRKEEDEFQILSGVFEGKTTGTPIGIVIQNSDQKSKDYAHIADKFRPSHADYTYFEKYGIRDYRGGGRSSARETAARVAGGAIAKQFLKSKGITIQAFVSQVGDLILDSDYSKFNLELAEENIVRCPDPEMADRMISLIDAVRLERDTIGGVVTCVIKNTPAGLGEPVFDRLHAELGKAMLSINAVKGFEYGSGFEGVKMKGSQHNDTFVQEDGRVHTLTNHSGGIQGGISNGEDIYFRVAFKPVATIMQDQESLNEAGETVIVSGKGRHDPCVVPRAVPIVEAMAALVLADYLLLSKSNKLADI
ncbi:chorismate synthase [Algoriphagus boritolerans]|uniref:Chorismate synthase n=1 Tax=Algoriphagus boritolerans DSM 17298 = JCM 18970 TaxID=1120964 RepID=A0A1H5U5Z4_9BACT|nr:chorismate synthase [Algoriphagus boritolerans]SEF69721.1 chorismate synthase [Algoriphagus boritolerans DSM 17298 = JCM 18970]